MNSIITKYIDFLNLFGQSTQADFTQEIEALFSTDIKKVVNSNVVCTTREQLLEQIKDVKQAYGIRKNNILESFSNAHDNSHVIRWEIMYEDGDVDVVITILKNNDQGLITEVNEVFNQKNSYEWNS